LPTFDFLPTFLFFRLRGIGLSLMPVTTGLWR